MDDESEPPKYWIPPPPHGLQERTITIRDSYYTTRDVVLPVDHVDPQGRPVCITYEWQMWNRRCGRDAAKEEA